MNRDYAEAIEKISQELAKIIEPNSHLLPDPRKNPGRMEVLQDVVAIMGQYFDDNPMIIDKSDAENRQNAETPRQSSLSEDSSNSKS